MVETKAQANKGRSIRVLKSTADALKRTCPVHHSTKNVLCYTSSPYVCAKRRQLVKITNPGQKVTVQNVKSPATV